MSETVTIKDQISFTNVKESDANHFLRLLMTSHTPRGSICQLKSTFLETRTDFKLFVLNCQNHSLLSPNRRTNISPAILLIN